MPAPPSLFLRLAGGGHAVNIAQMTIHIHDREALAHLIVQVCREHADGYRRNISEFNTACENSTAERCACAASNTGWFLR